MFTKNNPMRSILSIIALFSCCTLAAQEYIPTYGREPMRGELLVYPTAREAAEARKQAELERAAKAYNVLPDTPVKPGEIPGLPFKTK